MPHTHCWHHEPGNPAAKAFVKHYPTPKAVRQAMRTGSLLLDILPVGTLDLPWSAGVIVEKYLSTFGDVDPQTGERAINFYASW